MLGTARIALMVYGLILIAGGAIGYVRAGSLVSLVAGVVFGLAAMAAGALAFRSPSAGLVMGFALSLTVGALFAWRFISTRALMPAGITLVLSVLMVISLTFALQATRSAPPR